MKTNLLILCLLTSAFAATVRSKPHGKHHASPKTSEADPEQWSEEKVLPTFTSFEASSQEQGDTDVSYDDGLVKEDGGLEETEQDEKSSPILLSEEALADLLRGSEEEEEEEEKAVEEVEEVEEVEDRSEQGEEAGDDGGAEMMAKEGEVERGSEEDSDSSSTESEIPVDMDYAGDSDLLESAKEEVTPLVNDNTDTNTDANADGDLIPTEEIQAGGDIPEENDYEAQDGDEATESLEERDKEGVTTESEGLEETIQQEASQGEGEKAGDNEDIEAQEAKNSVELGGADNVVAEAPGEGGEEESDRNDSGSHTKGKARKQKKNLRAKKVPEPRDEAATEESQQPLQKIHMERGPDAADNTVQKSKKRKAGKWASLVGMNPIQIRATEELFQDQLSLDEGKQEAPVNPCNNFRCKRGKTCKVNEDNKPVCVCQDPSCTPSVSEIEHVCGTDNKTYDTSCELFATKCSLEGTKRGHRLHLDYTGSCKYIAPCQEGELLQFPLRMRDWLKNVLLQMYERDMRNPGFLTPKQRVRVQKIYESERRLHAGDHPIEMLVRDFEKNYNMYIYPVHWQFAQMDQHPADRFLSHSELAPLRVPLVPMEHCTSRFFHECDADKDKLVSFKEWGHCFGIKDEDLDLNLLF
ncbi:hypothetical protein AGOR_G00191430 [Albula goreensis]|uniref:Kazal-like domain-containing protein n=1 Tax=Albula goreensis TaxID=1534307 RepID=A0A8T3CV37_9TELE|nr:hypothetical protein AGOR_G00191430 [Albula goreensis]